ncbi:sulfatase [Chitinophaga pendula]|uniref:sulfatase n=1 Tax=Chitinophaga TaxID=79328 RepID=UPI000BAFA25C|nr:MULTISPECIES: sulfatase [Chitinophaga]ASZ11979.1 sulfatase [Chitinophaga sp. MD30]UCJ04992.1 sulfatase [Chitinophaga pendula]
MNKLFSSLPVAALLCYSPQIQAQKNQPPNIIFFLVDDMGWQDTAVPFWDSVTLANQKFRTPNMVRLASTGMKFTNAYATSVCTPSRVSLLSGMNAARHRVTNWTSLRNKSTDAKDTLLQAPAWNLNGLSPDASQERSAYATPLPQVLKDNGYYTIMCGKAHFGADQSAGKDPLKLGFVKNIAGSAAGHPASYYGEKNYGHNPEKYIVQADLPGLEKYWGTKTFLTDALTREAILAMDTARLKKQPFFLYMAHYAVHLPFHEDERFLQKYLDAGLSRPEAAYATLIEGMDHSLGQLMDYLDKNGLAENTVVIFMSDNGGYSHPPREGDHNTQNYPLKGGKGALYEGGIREPMIVRWNGVTRPGSVSDQYMIMEDFYPTILEMAGIKKYKTIQTIDGRSIIPYLRNSHLKEEDRVLIWNYPHSWAGGSLGDDNAFITAIRQGSWKLIYWEKQGRLELYNLDTDIKEEHNLATKEPAKKTALAKLLTTMLKQYNAQLPTYIQTGQSIPYPDELP